MLICCLKYRTALGLRSASTGFGLSKRLGICPGIPIQFHTKLLFQLNSNSSQCREDAIQNSAQNSAKILQIELNY